MVGYSILNGNKFHFYAWRGGPKFWAGTVKEPREPEFLVAFADVARTRISAEYLTPKMVDDFLDSTAMPKGDRTRADYRKWALRFAHEFADDPSKLWENPKSRGELNEWRAKWKNSPKQHDYAGTVAVRILNWARDEGKIGAHYCDRLHRIYSVDRAEIVWTDADQRAFKEVAPPWVRRVMTLACETGLRPGDLVRLTRGKPPTRRREAAEEVEDPESEEILAAYPEDRIRDRRTSLRLIAAVVKTGLKPEDLLQAVKAYAKESEGYTRSKVCFSDNWLKMRRWEKGLAQI